MKKAMKEYRSMNPQDHVDDSKRRKNNHDEDPDRVRIEKEDQDLIKSSSKFIEVTAT